MKKYIDKYNQLLEEYNIFKSNPDNKKIRIRDIASKLNVSEAELLSLRSNKDVSFLSIVNLDEFFNKIFNNNKKIMFLIRSDFVVHEKIVSTEGLFYKKGMITDSFDSKCPLVCFNPKLISYYFYEKNVLNKKRELRSFQFFDKYGNAILKIYLKSDNDSSFDQIANFYKIVYNYELQKNIVRKGTIKLDKKTILHIDLFENKELVNNPKQINNDKLRFFLNAFSEKETPIQIHAYGIDSIQYHRGIVKNIVDFGPWLNVIDKKFNIHVLENKILKTSILEYKNRLDSIYLINIIDENNNLVLGIAGLEKSIDDFNEVIRNGVS